MKDWALFDDFLQKKKIKNYFLNRKIFIKMIFFGAFYDFFANFLP